MARVPLIERPCPLAAEEQRNIAGHCSRCARDVHVLDDLDDAARAALLRSTPGSICVRYAVPRPQARAVRASALGMALAATLSAPGVAADPARVLTPAHGVEGGVLALPAHTAQMSPDESQVPEEREIIFVGGVASAADAQWVDVSTLPALPVRRVTGGEDDWGALAGSGVAHEGGG